MRAKYSMAIESGVFTVVFFLLSQLNHPIWLLPAVITFGLTLADLFYGD